ncbi:helix-turn-helix domain-containing protein [Kribbella sp. NPDC058245]|uniref:helix-turn-helix domain-containing protein n=1 Tax=Kribbella sp. NPDC058245 TaxID=3346399 RepID=UPI0036ECCC87
MEDFEDVLEAVGPRLKTLRVERGTTLAQLSESTGISVSTLSRLESGQRKPTLELLLPLARAHQVQLDELVDAPTTGDPRIHAKPVKHHGGATVIPLSKRPGGLQAYKQIVPKGWPGGEVNQKTHEGYDWVYVLSGKLRIVLGDNDFILTAGEVAEFDTRVPHWFGNAAAGPTELLCLYGPQGERMHVRARTR